MTESSSNGGNDVSLTYKYLLVFSTLSAVFFCWLYVTKPTTISPSTETKTSSIDDSRKNSTEDEPNSPSNEASSFEALSHDSLPGDTPSAISDLHSIPLAQTPSTESVQGFEETNDKIQHILTAQSGTTSERIVIEVPVIYQTRGLRLDPTQAKEAQRVLRALKIYQSQLKKLHKDGQNIQKAWNNLLLAAQPIDALRADSPSLPATELSHPGLLKENSAHSIQLTK